MCDAHNVTGLTPDGFTPVTLKPTRAVGVCCCCVPQCWVSLPAGFSSIVTRFGADVSGKADDGTWAPGCHCWLPWYRVSRLVSKQFVVFDTPVKECRTSDNIPVSIDVLLVCRVSNARKFVYSLGPEKLDDLLRATQEELLRCHVSKIPIDEIFDLHGANTEHWKGEMNSQFEKFGVTIENFTIRDVEIPDKMATTFEQKTLYESRTIERVVMQEQARQALHNGQARQKLTEENRNAKMAAEENLITTQAKLSKEVREVEQNTEKEAALLNAKREATKLKITTDAELEVAKANGELTRIERDTVANTELDVGKIECTSEAYELETTATANMEVVSLVAMGKKAIADAEGNAEYAFKAVREQENAMLRLNILEKLSHNPYVKIATTYENDMGLAPGNSLVTQIVQQGVEAFRMKVAEYTAGAVTSLSLSKEVRGGVLRPVPQVMS